MLPNFTRITFTKAALVVIGTMVLVSAMALSDLSRPRTLADPITHRGGTQLVAFQQRGMSARGAVSLVDAAQSLFTVSGTSHSLSLVQVSAQTQFSGLTGGLAALRVGMAVVVEGVSQPDGSILASRVTISCATVSASTAHGGKKHGSGDSHGTRVQSSAVLTSATRVCGAPLAPTPVPSGGGNQSDGD